MLFNGHHTRFAAPKLNKFIALEEINDVDKVRCAEKYIMLHTRQFSHL